MAFKDFLKIVKEVQKELEMDDDFKEEELREVYLNLFSEDELIRPEHQNGSGELICPYTSNSFKQKKRFVKSAVTFIIKTKVAVSQNDHETSIDEEAGEKDY
jgi:hypothetical protein